MSTTARSTATSSGCAASSAWPTAISARSKRFTARATASPMADAERRRTRRFERPSFAAWTSLTIRILTVNIIALALLAGSFFFLDNYRRQLLEERFRLARSEAQITAEALVGVDAAHLDKLLVQVGKEQNLRLRLYAAD